jgi:hypothetical protein
VYDIDEADIVSKEVFDKINPVDYDKTETLTKKEKIE